MNDFGIVLIDTHSEYNNIVCIYKTFENIDIDYYAISYRWGEHHQWRIITPLYIASITSFSKDNLLKLCKKYINAIRYLWIDTICINQMDIDQRKKTIYHMDDIYRRSKKIIAVPDLCYCDQNVRMNDISKEDIELAIHNISHSEQNIASQIDPWSMSYENILEYKEISSMKGSMFIRDVVNEWAQRCWVISERVIGVEDNKLEIILLRADVSLPCLQWKNYFDIDWHIKFDQYNMIRSIINSKSTKFVDRFYAILPHTKYKHITKIMKDQKLEINNMIELKMELLKILDIEGKIIMLEDQFALDNNNIIGFLPSFLKDEPFHIPSMTYNDVNYFSSIEVMDMTRLKIKSKYVYINPPIAYTRTLQLLNTLVKTTNDKITGINIVLCKRKDEFMIARCIGFNNIWVIDEIYSDDEYELVEYSVGEFLVY